MFKRWFGLGLIFIVSSLLMNIITTFYPDILWFRAFGYESVWWFVISSQIGIFLAATGVAFVWLLANYLIAKRFCENNVATPKTNFKTPFQILNQILADIAQRSVQPKPNQLSSKALHYVMLGVIAVLALMLGLTAKAWWHDIYIYLHQVPYGESDPILGKDISFYLFSLPFIEHIRSWISSLVFMTLVMTGWYYFSKNFLLLLFSEKSDKNPIKPHLLVLASIFVGLISVNTWIDMHNMLLSPNGSVFGANYTDVHARLFYMKGMVWLWAIEAVLLLFAAFRQSLRLPSIFLGLLVVFSFTVGKVYPGLLQSYVVAPNELEKESPYIDHNIKFTRLAYGLDKIEEAEFPVKNNLSIDDIKRNDVTIRNVRLWNREPLKQTFSQLQEIRLYYEFTNVDVDRYVVDGRLQQVMLSPRELDPNQLAREAQTWINRHIVYTHGYGTVLSPVNEVTEEGLPRFYVKDLPSVSTIPDIKVTRPGIYFGEQTNDYVIANTKEQEFDYPKGDNNVYTHYQGTGGVVLDSFIKKLAYAIKYSESKFIFNTDIQKDSRLIYDRNIRQIVNKLTPFLYFDKDPYLVIRENGEQVWMLDGYTLSNKFPYSEPYGRSLNYIRNSVKVTIDAYNGETHFYVADSSDPIIATYAGIYRSLFKPFDAMPEDIKAHIRYPKNLFEIQANMYETYHMTDTKVFYNKEDVWDSPLETYDGRETQMEAYYLVTKIPGDDKESFVLMQPYTPTNKNNMIAWMAAKCDVEDYGKLKVFKFPKEKTIYGPMQIESRIDQDTDISQKLTLWDQAGSRVIRGNLMVIPVEESLIYAEPIYLQATQSKLPELKRVIFSYNDKVVMGQSLDEAISKTFNESYSVDDAPKVSERIKQQVSHASQSVTQLIDTVVNQYNSLKNAAKDSNWSQFGLRLEKLGELINELKTAKDD